MKVKRGISLVVLIITIIIMVLLAGLAITGTSNVISRAQKNDFAVELSTITDKIKEYYLTFGNLPVKNAKLTFQEIVAKQTNDVYKEKLNEEVALNNDLVNEFYIVDLTVLNVDDIERGMALDDTDVFLVSSANLNLYYLKGVELEEEIYFSMAKLTNSSKINQEISENITQVALKDDLIVTKNINTWTNEIKIHINNMLNEGETIRYSIAGQQPKTVENSKDIIINKETLTDAQKTALTNNKTAVVEVVRNGSVIKTTEINIGNLDVLNPTLGTMDMVNTTNASCNTIKINFSDEGGSEIKAIYYDYNKILKDGVEKDYYLDKNLGSRASLLKVGKISTDGKIKLEKHIKSILVVATDNAGNISNVVTYNIENQYLVSK